MPLSAKFLGTGRVEEAAVEMTRKRERNTPMERCQAKTGRKVNWPARRKLSSSLLDREGMSQSICSMPS
jgi:hypothetical protein